MRQRNKSEELYRRFKWPVRLTWSALLAERLAQAFWPLASLAGFGYTFFAAFGARLPTATLYAGISAILLGGAVLLVLGLRKFRAPSLPQARDRLDSTLPARPIETLLDRPALGADDGIGQELWAVHVKRVVDATGPIRAVPASPELASRDPWGFRLAAAWAFAVALLFLPVPSFDRLKPTDMLASSGGAVDVASWEGWVEPPAYTRLSPLYLNDLEEDAFAVPAGSEITVRGYGRPGDISVQQSVSQADAGMTEAQVARFAVERDGQVTIIGPEGRRFDITVTPDQHPRVSANDPIEKKGDGSISLPFHALDDYAVVGGTATMSLDIPDVERHYGLRAEPDERDDAVLELPMPFAGDRRSVSQALVENMAEHPWAGMPVNITLSVFDDRAQSGSVDLIALQLPRRQFFDPLARAIVEQRRDLLWARANAGRVVQILRAVSYQPDEIFDSETAYLMLRTAINRLDTAQRFGVVSAELQGEVAQALWSVAVKIEDGNLQDAMDRLKLAQERLDEALENGASDEEIEALMQELRQAMKEYLEQLQQRAGETDESSANRQMMELSSDQLDEMMDRMEELMEQGKRAQAQDLLNQLRRMTENLQMAERDQQRSQSGESQRAIEELTETMRRQQALNDRTFQQMQNSPQGGDRSGEGQEGQAGNNDSSGSAGSNQGDDQALSNDRGGGGQPGEGAGDGRGGSAEAGLADQQQGLRSQLQTQTEAMPTPGSEPGRAAREALNQAGRAMEGAEGQLRQGDLSGAMRDQAQAMEALREGVRQLAEEMQQGAEGRGQQGEAVGRSAPNPTRDPLGRQFGNDGQAGTDERMLADQDQHRRALELLDQIQRRSAEQDRPLKEREYLKRLIEQY